MSHYAVHSPFQSDPRFADNYQDETKSARYLAYATMIEGMDQSLGDLMDHLEAKGIAENTLILFLGDNGGDAPDDDLDGIASCAPLRGRKGGKWEGGMRVPFIAAWGKANPDNAWQQKLPIVANSFRQEVGICYDLFPTLTELVDAPVPEDHVVDGRDLAPLISGEVNAEHRNAFLNHYPHPRRGVSHFFTTWRDGNWKVIYDYFAEGDQRYALYDLAADPGESHNLASQHPERLRSLMQGLVNELEAMGAVYPVRNGEPIQPVLP
jgi:arylsulfatase A-like enzyme